MVHSFPSKLENFNSPLWQLHVPVPEEIALQFIEENNRRIICTINGALSIRTALMKNSAYWFILVNKKTKQSLQITQGDTVQIKLEKDKSTFGHEMPEELEILLEQDESGQQLFSMLTIGKQRSLIYIVNKVKNSQSRLNKALAILEHLKEVKGELDFKKLNEKIKYYNNLYK
ncbi:MAG: DUF1905 domain-containing protein [Cyclobacteriaceae bacterium]